MQELNIKMSLDDLNQLLGIISEKPFKEVFLLIQKLQLQGSEQLKKLEAKE